MRADVHAASFGRGFEAGRELGQFLICVFVQTHLEPSNIQKILFLLLYQPWRNFKTKLVKIYSGLLKEVTKKRVRFFTRGVFMSIIHI